MSLSSLGRLYLQNNKIVRINPLKSLKVFQLYLNDNRISDIGSLGCITNLVELYLSNNEISDISPLGSLASLVRLDLDNNEISDISPLASLINLVTQLALHNNQIFVLARSLLSPHYNFCRSTTITF